MRYFILLIFSLLIPVTASAQAKPYHVFRYDVPVGHYATDDLTIPERLFAYGSVQGGVTLNKCTQHETYISGARFIFKNGKAKASVKEMFAMICDASTEEMYASHVRRIVIAPDEVDNEIDEKKRVIGTVGTRIPFTIQWTGNTLKFVLGGQSFSQKLDFEVEGIDLIGVGSNGVVRFFEDGLAAQNFRRSEIRELG